MKIGFSTNAFAKESLSYAIKSISSIGYDGVEIVLDTPHNILPTKKSRIDSIKRNLKDHGLEVTNLNANTVSIGPGKKINNEKFEPSLSNSNSKLRKWRIDYTKKAIELAKKLESPSISITSGIFNNQKEKSLQNFKNSLEILAYYAEKKNILIAIEYEPGLLLGNSEDVYPFVFNQLPNVGLNLDVCHAQVLGENISKTIMKFNKKIFHIHISDCKNKTHYHLIPGLGDINFYEMYETLKKMNYKEFLTAELYTYSSEPETAAKAALNYLRKLVN